MSIFGLHLLPVYKAGCRLRTKRRIECFVDGRKTAPNSYNFILHRSKNFSQLLTTLLLRRCQGVSNCFPSAAFLSKSSNGASYPGGSICAFTRSIEPLAASIEPWTCVPGTIATHSPDTCFSTKA